MSNARATMIALFIAGLGMLLVWSYIQQTTDNLKKDFGTSVSVVVASEDISEMDIIEPSSLRVINIPSKFQQPGSIAKMEDIYNAVAAIPILKGSLITSNMLLIKGPDTGISSQVTIGKRAVSLAINDINGVTKMIRPGDRIDIVAPIQWGKGNYERDVKPIMQDVLVIAVGQRITNDVPAVFKDTDNRQTKQYKNTMGKYNTITVEVSPQQALELTFITTTSAGLYYILRNPADREIQNLPPVTMEKITGGKKPGATGKLN